VPLDYRLLVSLVRHVITSPDFKEQYPGAAEGAILIFMPGVGEISRLVRDLQASVPSAHVLPLHGGLSGRDQAAVFKEGAPRGFSKKVVVSTNVAETSITIPDVTLVIDSARVKESGYDPVSRMACLVENWASQDSIRQRRGRAGRVRQGMAIHVTLTKRGHDGLPEHSLPEVKRSPLEQVVLQLVAMHTQVKRSIDTERESMIHAHTGTEYICV
jgi:ATP-dependent RNA helicase DHX57